MSGTNKIGPQSKNIKVDIITLNCTQGEKRWNFYILEIFLAKSQYGIFLEKKKSSQAFLSHDPKWIGHMKK